MKNSASRVFLPSITILSLSLLSACANLQSKVTTPNETVEPESSQAEGTPAKSVVADHRTDRTTGALPAKAKPEAEKQAEEVTTEDAATKALRELRRREREEDERRVRRNITEDQITQKQAQQR